jgi:putative ABC transport system substrate-binding protein
VTEPALAGKWLELIKEISPSALRALILHDPNNPTRAQYLRSIEAVNAPLKIMLTQLDVQDGPQVKSAIEKFSEVPSNGVLLVMPGSTPAVHRNTIIDAAMRHRLPAIYPTHFYVANGGLASYGADYTEIFRRAATYVDRILRGENAGDLPIQLPTKHSSSSTDRQGARPRDPADPACPRRRGDRMRRRDFIKLVGAVTIAWPVPVLGNEPKQKRRVAVLMGGIDDAGYRARLASFRQQMQQLGWLEGDNLETDVRWAGNDANRIAALAREIVSRNPDVILAGPSHVVLPLQKATRTIPIVFVNVSDPVRQGIVDNLARPAGNVTGFTNMEFSLLGKWLQMIKEIAPGTSRVAVMIYTGNAASPNWFATLHEVAPSLDIEPIAAAIRDAADIGPVIESLARSSNGGLVIPSDTLVVSTPVRGTIIELAARNRVPAVYGRTEFVSEGGLMSYGIDQRAPYRSAAAYVDRILRGTTPRDLPVQQPTKYELAINLKSAKALGLDVPPTLLARADEVIE